MVTVNVPLSENLKDYLDAQVAGGEFIDAGDYIRDLLRRDRDRRMSELRDIVQEAMDGGISSRTTADIFAEAVDAAKVRGTYRD